MAAGLLFTMVFFVRLVLFFHALLSLISYPADHHVLGFGVRLHQSYRPVQQAQSSA